MSTGKLTRLVQLMHPDEGRRAALVYEDQLHLLATYRSVYSFAMAAVATRWKLRDLLSTDLSGIVLDFGAIEGGRTRWKILPCFDHPEEPGRCVVSSAGPPWRYIGSGASLRGYAELLEGGASAEIAAVYAIGPAGEPRRVGLAPAVGGRFPALGPALTLEPQLARVEGVVRVLRGGNEVLARKLSGGDAPLHLALASIEPDHFESSDYRRYGDAHVHFLGERLFGMEAQIPVAPGDEVSVEIDGLGWALRNPIEARQPERWRAAATPL